MTDKTVLCLEKSDHRMEDGGLCKKAPDIDPQIRFTGIVDDGGILAAGGNRRGTEGHPSPEEITCS